MISKELARIAAHICGDGYIGMSIVKRSKKELIQHPRNNKLRKRWYVRYVNEEPVLIEQFVEDIKKEFNRKVVFCKKHEHEISGKKIYSILKMLGAGKSREWFIADEILKSNKNTKVEWLKALYDDEAYVSVKQKRIVLNMTNQNGLKQIKKLLNEFNINSTLKGPYKCKKFESYHLNIYRDSIKNYSDKIEFYHPKKKAALNRIIHGSAAI